MLSLQPKENKFPHASDSYVDQILVAAEAAAKFPNSFIRSQAETRLVFVRIQTKSDKHTFDLVEWMEQNGIIRHGTQTANQVGFIHSYRGYPEHYIYANIPAYLLGK